MKMSMMISCFQVWVEIPLCLTLARLNRISNNIGTQFIKDCKNLLDKDDKYQLFDLIVCIHREQKAE